MEAFDAYIEYLAVSRHFTAKSYNYNKYNGKVNANHQSFLERRDRGLFYKLSLRLKTHQAVKDFFIANFTKKDDFSSYNMLEEKSFECYNNWVKVNSKLSKYFYSDLVTLGNMGLSLKELCISKDGALPIILQMFIRGKINMETLTIFDIFFKFIERNKDLCTDSIFKKYATKINKYKTFLVMNHFEIKQIIDNTIAK